MRTTYDMYPNYAAEIEAIDRGGITVELLQHIISLHEGNSRYNKGLYERYETLQHAVPIFDRVPRFCDEKDKDKINNRLNNDFFGEIIDMKVGYFAGRAIAYSYSTTDESEEDTGGDSAVEEAVKTLSDFVTRNNMYDADMEVTKYAAICGYSGRLLYIDKDRNERVMPVAPYETIILAKNEITEPSYAVRYYEIRDIDRRTSYNVEFYDGKYVWYYTGQLNALQFVDKKLHLFDYCPLQGIPNNREMLGDAEKVLSLIDGYDRVMSDTSNEIESFANAYMVYENVNLDEETFERIQSTGAIEVFNPNGNGKVYFLVKDTNDTMIEHHLERTEDNIYRFSKTPNLADEAFGTASGVSLKFKITGLESKCGMFQAKMQSAGTYMFKVLASAWRKKKIAIDPLQCFMDFKRNFPLDLLSEAQTATALINAGLPEEVVFGQLSFVDDVDYIMQLIEEKKESIPSLLDNIPGDEEEEEEEEEEEKLEGKTQNEALKG